MEMGSIKMGHWWQGFGRCRGIEQGTTTFFPQRYLFAHIRTDAVLGNDFDRHHSEAEAAKL